MNIQLLMKPRAFLFLCCLFSLSIFLKSAFAQSSSPTLVYPKNDVFLSDTIVTFEWNAVPNAISYHLQVSTDSLFSGTTIDKIGIVNTIDTANLSSDSIYYWRVQADTGSGFSNWSAVFNFTIFTPLDLSGLTIWLRADIGVTSSNDSVSTWSDQSGMGNDAVQSITGDKPVFIDSISLLGFNPILRFDGINDYLEFNELTNIRSAFFVLKHSTGNQAYGSFFGHTSQYTTSMGGGGGAILIGYGDNVLNGLAYVNGVNTVVNTIQKPIEYTIYSFIPSGGFIANTISHNGNSGFEAWNGDYAEIITYSDSLNDSLRTLVEQYLRYKYAPPVNLGPDIYGSYEFCPVALDAEERFVNYQWSTDTTDTNQTLSVTQPGTYSVTVTDIFGFTSSDTVNVYYPGNFNPFPDTVICLGDTIIWDTGLDTSLYDFLWQDSSTSSSLQIYEVGSYYVTITDTNSCSMTANPITITIDTFALIVTLGSDDTLCVGNYITLYQGASLVDSFLWSDGTDSSAMLIDSTGIYSVTVIDSLGCVALDSISIYIKGNTPDVGFTFNTACFGDSTQFNDTSSTSDFSSIINWLWNFGDDSTSSTQNIAHLYDSASIYNVTLTVSTDSGCINSIIKQVYVAYLPQVNFIANNNCVGYLTSFQDISILQSDSIIDWFWDFGIDTLINDTSSLQNPTYSFSTEGSFNVELQIQTSYGCKDSSIKSIDIYPSVKCLLPTELVGLSLWLTADSVRKDSLGKIDTCYDQSGNNNNAYQIDSNIQPLFADSVLNNHPVLRFDGINDYLEFNELTNIRSAFFVLKHSTGNQAYGSFFGHTSQYTTSIGGGDTTLIGYGDNVLNGLAYVNGVNTVVNTIQKPIEYTIYSFIPSGGFIANTISHNGNNGFKAWNGDYAEIIIYSDSLNDSLRTLVEQYLRYKYAPPVNLGPDVFMYGFCDTTIDAGTRFLKYTWSTDTTDTNQTLSVTQPGTYSVTVTGIFGFSSSDIINVYFPGNLKPFNDTTICLGDTIIWDTQLDTSLYSFLWQDSSINSLLNISQAGQYYVKITDTSNCSIYSDTITVVIDTFALVATLGTDDTLCAGNYIALQQGASQAVLYLWSDGSDSSALQIDTSGTYWVTVIDSIGCVVTDTITVTIQGIAPNANFIADTTCFSDSSRFTDLSTVIFPYNIISWFWDFGDSITDTIQNPIHLYDSVWTYNVTLTVVTDSGCSANTVKAVDVHVLPQANFSPVLGCSGAGVSFADLSSVLAGSLTGWEWDFGDPSSGADNFDTLQNPTHVFADSGSYNVKLKVFTNNGCVDSITQIVTIKHSPVAGFSYPPACDGEYVTFTDVSITTFPWSITNWSWNFGDSSTSALSNPIHLYSDTGMYIVSLMVQALDGCVDTVVDSVIVNTVPAANFIGDDLCINTPYQFIDSSYVAGGIIASWYWDFDGLGTSTDQNPLFTFSDTGFYPVSLTVASSSGCTNPITDTVEVRDLPLADFSFDPSFGPPPLTVSFTGQSVGANSYYWDFGDGNTSTTQNPTNLYTDTGIYQIELNAFDTYGCEGSIVKDLKVLRPLLDIAVVDITTDLQSNYLTISVNLSNMGTRDINGVELHAQINGGITIREDWAGTLQSGGSMTYDFNSGFVLPGNFDLQYVCVSALNPNNDNDDVPSNNEQCITFSDGFIALEPYPNPTDNEINIEYIIPYSEFVEVILYDAIGKRVSTLFSGKAEKGLNKILLNSASLNEGMYFYRISFIDRTEVKKFVVSK